MRHASEPGGNGRKAAPSFAGPYRAGPLKEFHVAREARERYGLEAPLFSSRGRVVFADFRAARDLAARLNARRPPGAAVSAGQLNALGLIDELLHLAIDRYRADHAPDLWADALARLDAALGREAVDGVLLAFAEGFPPAAVYRGELTPGAYLAGESGGTPHRELLLEELLLLRLENENPAAGPLRELFDDSGLGGATAYPALFASLENFLGGGGPDTAPGFAAAGGESLLEVLRAPARSSPSSLAGQLRYLIERLGAAIGAELLGGRLRALSGLDLIAEEERVVVVGPAGPGGGGEAVVPDYASLEAEPERFTADRDWMPRLVLIAKNAFVWLDQLTKEYGREIATLDAIPDEELDELARRGVSGLWLIGLWERSPASKEIKRRMGNPDAVASAYSLLDYAIAADLGGEAAVDRLRERAARRGVRLASDMVPNHTGLDSRWVMEHPEWFIRLPHSPYPNYSFGGPDLSWDPGVGIHLEDHYYDRSDAAVVFRRTDRRSGEASYLYHGNDGTGMPWNDTAQLDYLNPAVREAVIQTILHVARQFPVIRFDAAMTLAKKHVQRLWYPEPGAGGAVPSRAEHAMTKAQFNAAMPEEFWREVVDRCAVEAPDTLLLAEAFWMMEGYFVRTLGMHRVYNSAFMNMMRDEKNAEYRRLIKETLEFEPEILKRYVNFMNNPDERTAAEQFGKGDKYFGVCTLMATLPGLPMLGHGQVEGYTEKYGMEYRRAYHDERPDFGLIEHHRSQVFPLLRRRALFAEVEHFALYDVVGEGGVLEDVFAYSNRAGEERSLVVYHNRYGEARGWLRDSVGRSARTSDGGRVLRFHRLGEGLALSSEPDAYAVFRDAVSGLEHLGANRELSERGLYLELGPYERRVFLDWREVRDTDGRYARLAASLGGRGVENVEEAVLELEFEPVLTPFRELVEPSVLRRLAEGEPADRPGLLEELGGKLERLSAGAAALGRTAPSPADFRPALEATLGLPELAAALPGEPEAGPGADPAAWGALLGWLAARAVGRPLEEWRLDRALAASLREAGVAPHEADRAAALAGVLAAHENALSGSPGPEGEGARALLEGWLSDSEARRFLGVNRYGDALYLNKEALEALLAASLSVALVLEAARGEAAGETPAGAAWAKALAAVKENAAEAGYDLEKMLEAGEGEAAQPLEGGVVLHPPAKQPLLSVSSSVTARARTPSPPAPLPQGEGRTALETEPDPLPAGEGGPGGAG